MRQMASMSIWERMKTVTGLGKAGAFLPGSNVAEIQSRHRPSQKCQGTGGGPEEEAEAGQEEVISGWQYAIGQGWPIYTGLARRMAGSYNEGQWIGLSLIANRL